MSTGTFNGLESRVADLERVVSRQRRVFVFVVALILLLAVSAQVGSSRTFPVVEAERLDIKDSQGRVVGAFGALEGGGLGLFFEDRDEGRIDLSLRHAARSELRVKNKWGSLSYASVGPIANEAYTNFEIAGAKKNGGMEYFSSDSGSSLSLMRDRNYLDSLRKPTEEWAQEKSKSTGLDMVIAPDGTTALRVCDKNGKYRSVVGSMHLLNKATGVKTIRPPGSFCVFSDDGTALWSAP